MRVGPMFSGSQQKLRTLLAHRKLLQSKAIAIENDLRSDGQVANNLMIFS